MAAYDRGAGRKRSLQAGASYAWTLFPGLVASAVAMIAFVLFSGSFFGTLYAFPDYQPRLIDLLLAVPLGLVGALTGALFMFVFRQLRRIMQPLSKHVILCGLISGLSSRANGLDVATHSVQP